MSYHWQVEALPGETITADELVEVGIGKRFDEQADAEQWLTAFFAELLDLGVAFVTLLDEDRPVYGPMDLTK